MDGTPTTPDLERELRDLRARAYGPDPDIQDDPAAFARLAELEDLRVSAGAAPPDVDDVDASSVDLEADAPDVSSPSTPESALPDESDAPSMWRRLTSPPSGPVWLAAGAIVTVVGVAYAITWLFGAHPDATLWPTNLEADDQTFTLMQGELGEIDVTTLESYETFRGVEPWSAVDIYGNPCLIVIERSTSRVVQASCTPKEADLITDIGAWPVYDFDFAEGLPAGSIIRFQLRGNSVDAFVHAAPEAD